MDNTSRDVLIVTDVLFLRLRLAVPDSVALCKLEKLVIVSTLMVTIPGHRNHASHPIFGAAFQVRICIAHDGLAKVLQTMVDVLSNFVKTSTVSG